MRSCFCYRHHITRAMMPSHPPLAEFSSLQGTPLHERVAFECGSLRQFYEQVLCVGSRSHASAHLSRDAHDAAVPCAERRVPRALSRTTVHLGSVSVAEMPVRQQSIPLEGQGRQPDALSPARCRHVQLQVPPLTLPSHLTSTLLPFIPLLILFPLAAFGPMLCVPPLTYQLLSCIDLTPMTGACHHNQETGLGRCRRR
jgi:hypothetical protein